MQFELVGIVVLLFLIIVGLCTAFIARRNRFALIFCLVALLLGVVACLMHFDSHDHISSPMSRLSDLYGVITEAFEHEHNDLSDLELLDSDYDTVQIGQCDIHLQSGVISNLQFTAIYSKDDTFFEKLYQINSSRQLFAEKKTLISDSIYSDHTISISNLNSCLQKLDAVDWLHFFDLINEESVNLLYHGQILMTANRESSIPVYVYCQDELVLHNADSSILNEDTLYHSFMLVSHSKSVYILFPVNPNS